MAYSKPQMVTLTADDIQLVYNLIQMRLGELVIVQENPSIITVYQNLLTKFRG